MIYVSRIANLVPKIGEFGVCRMIAFGITSAFSRRKGSIEDAAFADELAKAEADFMSQCEKRGIRWTTLRSTQIYGAPTIDPTIAFVARVIQTLGVFRSGAERRD